MQAARAGAETVDASAHRGEGAVVVDVVGERDLQLFGELIEVKARALVHRGLQRFVELHLAKFFERPDSFIPVAAWVKEPAVSVSASQRAELVLEGVRHALSVDLRANSSRR